jgi:hypothetical protein
MSALNSHQPGVDYGTAKQQFLEALTSSLPAGLEGMLESSAAVGKFAEELRLQVGVRSLPF